MAANCIKLNCQRRAQQLAQRLRLTRGYSGRQQVPGGPVDYLRGAP